MIIKTNIDVQKFVSKSLALGNFDNLKPSLENALISYILPLVGEQFIDKLELVYNDEAAIASYKKALEKTQRALVFYGLMEDAKVADVIRTSTGLQIVETSSNKTAFEYQKRDLIKKYADDADTFTDDLLEFLEKNKDTFKDFSENISIYSKTKEFIINNAKEFTDYRNINESRRTFIALKGSMKDVELLKIKPSIGNTVFDTLKEMILDDDLNDKYKALHELLKPAFANLVVADAIPELNFKFKAGGVELTSFAQSNTKSTLVDDEFKKYILNCQTKGIAYLKEAVDFINANPTDFGIIPETQKEIISYANDKNKKHYFGF